MSMQASEFKQLFLPLSRQIYWMAWRLTGNVHATNVNGEQFETPELFWGQKAERVYSDSAITIIQPPTEAAKQAKGDNAKGTIIKGVGFEANQDMTKYTIRHPSGIFPIDD